ncbi:Uncharacterised protein [Mycobacteroides abscessus subsp. abscessus]|nr:Uncharacterised protein [Mycobacteroides abscessus subsp. abscessus]
MPGLGVERLGLSTEALGRAGVEEHPVPLGGGVGVDDGHRPRSDDNGGGFDGGTGTELEVTAGGHPRVDAAVEDTGAQPRPPEQPPRAGGPEACVVVVDDDLGVRVDAPTSYGLLEPGGTRQRVASRAGIAAVGVGQLRIEVDVDRVRQVAAGEVVPPVGSELRPADVEQPRRNPAGSEPGELLGGDEDIGAGHGISFVSVPLDSTARAAG